MTRLLQGLLALCLLISQAGWLDHLYHQHDLMHDKVCERCLVGYVQDYIVSASESYCLQEATYFLVPVLSVPDLRVEWAGSYLSRAPPGFL
jgi:hypothetical protein